MITGALINGLLGFIMLLTLCFCLGDLTQIIGTRMGQAGLPFIAVLAQGTQSNAAASILTSMLIVLSTFCCITNIATASRQLFAFARDKAVPFHRIFSFVRCALLRTRDGDVANGLVLGAERVGHPAERGYSYLHSIDAAVDDQHRVDGSLQQYHVARSRGAVVVVHCVDIMRGAQADPQRAIAAAKIRPWTVGPTYQRVFRVVSGVYLCHVFLPVEAEPQPARHELGGGDVRRRHGILASVLCRLGAEGVRRTRGVCAQNGVMLVGSAVYCLDLERSIVVLETNKVFLFVLL
jgi:hypothetical protein